MKKLILSIAALAAIIGTFGLTAGTSEAAPVSQQNDLRVSIKCSPKTNAQGYRDSDGVLRLVVDGTPQTCWTTISNYGTAPVTGIVVTHPTSNTLVSITGKHVYGAALNCTVADGCESFTLAGRAQVQITEQLTFNVGQDGRGLTKAYATGVQNGVTLSAYGAE